MNISDYIPIMYACMHACMYVCMYVCMCVSMRKCDHMILSLDYRATMVLFTPGHGHWKAILAGMGQKAIVFSFWPVPTIRTDRIFVDPQTP